MLCYADEEQSDASQREKERETEQETRRESIKMSSLINQSQATIRMKCTSYTDYVELSVDRKLTKNDKTTKR
jgi:hypothetical protein